MMAYENTDFSKWTRDDMKSSILECIIKMDQIVSNNLTMDPYALIDEFMESAVCYLVDCKKCCNATHYRPFLGDLVSLNGTWINGNDDLENEYFADMNDAPARDLRNLTKIANRQYA